MSKTDLYSIKIITFKKLPNTKAWKLTSYLVRTEAKGICYTCGKSFPKNKLVSGHFIDKWGHAATYFDLDNLRAQCFSCNRMKHGNLGIYALKLQKEIGDIRLKKLQKKSSKSKVWTKKELDEITLEREKMIKKLSTD